MKKKFITSFSVLFFLITHCFSQNKIERYCELITQRYNKISINFGSPDLYIIDSTAAKCIVEIPRLNNTIDALNYMSERGWKLITSSAVGINFKVFYLKKEFDKQVPAN